MKKLIGLALGILLFISCTNSDVQIPQDNSGKLYPVKFITSLNFDEENSGLQKSIIKMDSIYNPDDTICPPDNLLFYHYLVYNINGSPVKQITGYGMEIEDSLASGQYYISIIGIYRNNLSMDESLKLDFKNYFTDKAFYSDAFYSTFIYSMDSVGSDTCQYQSKYVKLERMWGELDIEIQDRLTFNIPALISSIQLRIEGESTGFYLQSMKGVFQQYTSIPYSLAPADFRNQSTLHALKSYPTNENKVDVYLDFLSGDSIASAIVKTVHLAPVEIKKGIQTTLKGNLGNLFENEHENGKFRLETEEKWINETINF